MFAAFGVAENSRRRCADSKLKHATNPWKCHMSHVTCHTCHMSLIAAAAPLACCFCFALCVRRGLLLFIVSQARSYRLWHITEFL